MPRQAKSSSILWKILLSTSIAITVLLAATGWFVQDQMLRAMSRTVENEMQVSSEAFESLWHSRAETLSSVSLVLSSMSDVRAAFSTHDRATIQDTAGEMWSKISESAGLFLVTDPQGGLIASLGGANDMGNDVPSVRQALPNFPAQTSGFVMQGGHLYQMVVTPVYVESERGPGLLNVLVAGAQVDTKAAEDLKNETGRSDFLFLVNHSPVASTLPRDVSAAFSRSDFPLGSFQRVRAGDKDYAVVSSGLHDIHGGTIGQLLIVRSLEPIRQMIAGLQRKLILTWIGAILGGLLLSYLLARRILEPVKQLDEAATEIAHQNYETRVAVQGNDELARLAQTFNAMCRSIQDARGELIRRERITTIGHLSSSIVHDLRNPLAAIYGGSELLMDGEWSTLQVKRLATNIYRSSRVIKDMLQELVDVSRGRIQPAEACCLREIVEAALETNRTAAEAQGVAFHCDVSGNYELPLERARIERVFLNLIGNALEAMPQGGNIYVNAEVRDNNLLVSVVDDGPGIPQEIRSALFQPFATWGKKNGLGLGLALSRQTILDHGGEMWADDSVQQGTCFCIKLPF